MNLWKKIDNFFTPKPYERAGAAVAAADILLYAKGLITRPERARDLMERVEEFQNLPTSEQAVELIPLYLDLESYITENESTKDYTKVGLRLQVYSALSLKNSTAPFVGFFAPGVDGAVSLAQELFSQWVEPALEVLGEKRVGEIVLSTVKDTVFDGVAYNDGVLDFSPIISKLKKEMSFDQAFRRVFNKVSLNIASPVMALRGTMPSVHTMRKRIIDSWLLLESDTRPAWQEQKVIPITPEAREMIKSVGMGELMTRGVVKGVETELVPKEGGAKPVRVTASALKDEAGNISGMVVAAQDLSEIRQLEEQKVRILEHAKSEAEAEVAQRTAELQQSKAGLEKLLESEKASAQKLQVSEQQQKVANQQLNVANQQLEAAQKDLQDKLLELERFNKVAVGRELKMVELKEEIAQLKGQKMT